MPDNENLSADERAANLLTALHKHICYGTDSVGHPRAWLDSAAYAVVVAALNAADAAGFERGVERAAQVCERKIDERHVDPVSIGCNACIHQCAVAIRAIGDSNG